MALGAVGVLLISVVFGGASRDNALRLTIVELCALPLLVLALWRLILRGRAGAHRLSLSLLGFALALPLLQLIPLPPSIWQTFPGRESLVLALRLADVPSPWAPLSLTPEATWGNFLALLAPAAVFLACLDLDPPRQRMIAAVIVGATLLSILVGILQLAAGGHERFYPYDVSTFGSAVGFFANRNHLATLILVAIPFSAVLGSVGGSRGASPWMKAALPAAFVLVGIAALAVVRSRAGILLAAPALSAALLAYGANQGAGRRWLGLALIGAVIASALLAVVLFQLQPLIDRFVADPQSGGRFEFWREIWTGSWAFQPAGSGLGSFETVYRAMERPETMQETYLNRAHNDYLELWLETGWLGPAGVGGFLWWWGSRLIGRIQHSGSAISLAAAAGILIVLLHSGFDYPLRTESILCLFAACCGLLEQPQGRNSSAV